MAVSSTIMTEFTSLQAQVIAAAPLVNASHATVIALQLNAGTLVADIQSALTSDTLLDTWTAPVDPGGIVSGFLGVVIDGTDQNSLSLLRGVSGRIASNLDQL
jgi:hypothetical protein